MKGRNGDQVIHPAHWSVRSHHRPAVNPENHRQTGRDNPAGSLPYLGSFDFSYNAEQGGFPEPEGLIMRRKSQSSRRGQDLVPASDLQSEGLALER